MRLLAGMLAIGVGLAHLALFLLGVVACVALAGGLVAGVVYLATSPLLADPWTIGFIAAAVLGLVAAGVWVLRDIARPHYPWALGVCRKFLGTPPH